MRIFNIMVSVDLGGIQQAYLDYSEALNIQGHEVINISSKNAEINKHLPGSIKLPSFTSWCLVSKLYLWILARFYKPDIMIAHGGRAINYAKSSVPKTVKLIGVAHNYTYQRLKRCDYVIVMTDHLKQYMIENGYKESNLFKIPNMLRVYKKYKKKKFHNTVVIGSYGRFVEQKGYEYLLKAVSILQKKGYSCKLIIGGEGEDKDKLKNLSLDLGIEDKVSFIGWVDNQSKFFDDIDIFCLPSIEEPFGIVLLEAMEHSTLIVSTKCAGPKEIFDNEKGAFLADIKSSESLADKLAEAIDNKDSADLITSISYKNLIDNYDIKKISDKLNQVIINL